MRTAAGLGAALLAVSISAAVAEPLTKQSTIEPDRVGPVRIGMSVRQASAAIGQKLVRHGYYDPAVDCYYVAPEPGPPGIVLMVVGGRIARADIASPAFATAAGVHVGTAEPELNRFYGGALRWTPHPYDQNGHWVIFSTDKRYYLVMVTDGTVVTEIHNGREAEAIGNTEGCS